VADEPDVAHEKRDGEQGGAERLGLFADRVFTLLMLSQVVLLALALAFTPWVIRLLAPGFVDDPGRYALAVDLTRITFPYLLLISVVTLYGGILNAIGRFASAAAAPILFNLSIMAALTLAWFFPTAGHAAAWGVLIAGFLEVLLLAADVTRQAEMKAMADAAIAAFGTIDILCANAGIFPAAKLGAMTEADFDAVIGTNLKGTFLSVSACLPVMRAKKNGRIILTSSITGPVTGYPGWSHYGASKAGQLGFMRTAAIELARDGITVNAVLPGNIATEGLAGLGEDYIRTMEASVPMRRLGSITDIANAALFFASEEAAYITGQSLVVDGGQILPESLTALEA